ncbi:uncharacterized protein [Clytia hemisphaerica]|uniref:Uncharacterized protein n=1 Tax=Clytia hemisphaerica TaxID=252671 RepID=A0A7M5USL9_9CNID
MAQDLREDFGRRKRVKRTTNFIGFSSVVDAILSAALIVLLLQQEELRDIPILVACIQLTNHEFLVLISSIILLRTGDRYYDRIDACGAWMIIHFLVAIGNASLLTFEIMDDYYVIINASILKKIFLAWKAYFLLLQIFGMIYCYLVVHKPIAYIKEKPKRTPHPLFTETNTTESVLPPENRTLQTDASGTARPSVVTRRPVSAVYPESNNAKDRQFRSNALAGQLVNHGYNRNSCYESYQSLTSTGPNDSQLRYTRNPAFESELSLDYANNYSPYDHMMMSNRNRLSYVEPIREATEQNIDYGTIGKC